MKKVFLTGSTGFVGREILKKLLEKGYFVKALIRNKNSIKISSENLELFQGDILNYDSVRNGIAGSDVVINLVGIIREIHSKNVTFENMHFVATKNCVDAAKELNVKRFIQMSANGTRANAASEYHKTKYKAEKYLMESGLSYTILRPSLIYGEHDSFINMLNDIMKKVPVFSYFGDGSYPMQPVSVYEVADIFVNCIEKDETVGKIYHICGDKRFTYKELLNIIMEITGRQRILLPIPEFLVEFGISCFGSFSWFPITRDQFTMLKEGNVCDNSDIFDITGVSKKDFKEVLRGYLK